MQTSALFCASLLCAALPLNSSAEPANHAAHANHANHAAHADQPLIAAPLSVIAGSKHYPLELANTGAQGTVQLLVKVDDQGRALEVTLHTGSRAPALDKIALEAVKNVRFSVQEMGAARQLLVPVEFWRDSVATLPKKTCAEFNQDAAYFKTTFPELPAREMNVFTLMIGTMFIGKAFEGKKKDPVAYARILNASADKMSAACTQSPDAYFVKTYHAMVKENGG